jgi:hypothetical protein
MFNFEETIMHKADILIHVHPELDANARTVVTRMLEGHAGVDCAEFNHHAHPHALIVKYDPDAVQGMQILQMVREYDVTAAMVGL